MQTKVKSASTLPHTPKVPIHALGALLARMSPIPNANKLLRPKTLRMQPTLDFWMSFELMKTQVKTIAPRITMLK